MAPGELIIRHKPVHKDAAQHLTPAILRDFARGNELDDGQLVTARLVNVDGSGGGRRVINAPALAFQAELRLVETLPLGGKRQLMLVTCAGESFLVGGGLESVETIVRLKAEVSLDVVAKSLDGTCE